MFQCYFSINIKLNLLFFSDIIYDKKDIKIICGDNKYIFVHNCMGRFCIDNWENEWEIYFWVK